MPTTHSTIRPGESRGDLLMWLRENAETNQESCERVRSKLVRAIQLELTPRQQKLLRMYYFDGLTMQAIAKQENITAGTVSRTLARARNRIQHVLEYAV